MPAARRASSYPKIPYPQVGWQFENTLLESTDVAAAISIIPPVEQR